MHNQTMLLAELLDYLALHLPTQSQPRQFARIDAASQLALGRVQERIAIIMAGKVSHVLETELAKLQHWANGSFAKKIINPPPLDVLEKLRSNHHGDF